MPEDHDIESSPSVGVGGEPEAPPLGPADAPLAEADVPLGPADAPLAEAGSPHADGTATMRWWLNLQIGLALGGGAFWFAGARWEQDFISGVGCGLILAALILRLGRSASAS